MKLFFALIFLFPLLLFVGVFGYFALNDAPVTQQETRLTIPTESILK